MINLYHILYGKCFHETQYCAQGTRVNDIKEKCHHYYPGTAPCERANDIPPWGWGSVSHQIENPV